MLQSLIRHHRIASIFLVAFLVGLAEIILMEAKYDYFSGGFLQSHPLTDNLDRFGFLSIALWIDLVFYGAIALLWGWLWSRVIRNPLIATYHYIFLTGSVCLVIVAIKYKLLTYFSDAINFHIIKNLGGGSLVDALLYILDESRIFVLFVMILIAFHFLGYILFRKSPGIKACNSHMNQHGVRTKRRKYPLYIIVVLVVSLIAITYAYSNDNVRFGMSKKISYGIVSSLLSVMTDFDGDGYGYFRFPPDPEPFDKTIYPGALDIPNNGVDEDGYAGDFQYPSNNPDVDSRRASEITVSGRKKHLVLIMLESARAEMLHKQVDGKYIAPNLRELVEQGTSFRYAYSHTGYTSSSLKAVFTGRILGLPKGSSLFDVLHNSGYFISVFSGQDESFGDIGKITGMHENADYFFDAKIAEDERVFSSTEAGSLRLDERRLLQEIEKRIAVTDWNRPQFMYINFQAAHFPYYHPGMPQILKGKPIPRSSIEPGNRQWVGMTYWNALAYADKSMGDLIDMLKASGIYQDCVIVVTGDHGESLFDDGFLGHGHAVNEIQTRIPLVFSIPGIVAREPVGQTDLYHLLLQSVSDNGLEKKPDDNTGDKWVFQFVGNLDRPSLIGTVEANERRTILDLQTRKVYFSDLGKWIKYRKLAKDGELYMRVKRIVTEWERLRWDNWRQRLASKNKEK